MLSSYPSIYSVYHKAVQNIFCEDVLVTEKVDGSQFSFGVFNGELIMRSKKAHLDVDTTVSPPWYSEKMFAPAMDTVRHLTAQLKEGYTYRAEVLCKPKHNVLAYARVPRGNLVLFDISTPVLGDYMVYPHMVNHAKQLGLEVVPALYYGHVAGPKELEPLLETESFLGGIKIEGIVIKNYARFGVDKHPLFAKMVREDFKEANRMEWKAGPSVREKIIGSLRTEARWLKAVQHLAEGGRLVFAPQDIGPLLKEVNQDILEELKEEIKDKLFDAYWKEISRGITRGLPEWYKEKLKNDSQGADE